jgi:hypothetical protein
MLSSLVCQLQASLIHGGLRQAHHRIGAHLRHDDGAHVRKPREAARTQEGGGCSRCMAAGAARGARACRWAIAGASPTSLSSRTKSQNVWACAGCRSTLQSLLSPPPAAAAAAAAAAADVATAPVFGGAAQAAAAVLLLLLVSTSVRLCWWPLTPHSYGVTDGDGLSKLPRME